MYRADAYAPGEYRGVWDMLKMTLSVGEFMSETNSPEANVFRRAKVEGRFYQPSSANVFVPGT